MTFGLNSLRAKTLAVICVLVVAPVVFVWLSSPFEDALGLRMRSDLDIASSQIADLVRMDAPPDDHQALAERFDVWVRVVDPQTNSVVVDADGTSPSWREILLFAPDPVPRIDDWDDTQPALPERPVIERGLEDGHHGGCSYVLDGSLLVCELAVRAQLTGSRPKVVHVSSADARGASGLYDERYQVLKIMGVVLALAAALGLWLAYRIISPLRSLREQVLERTRAPVSTLPVERGGDDEFGELADAFNELLRALEARREENEAFMADMAHEIKNPVAAIRAAAESLGKGKDVPAARAERLANILNDSSRRLDLVVTNFLELARAESGLPQARREEIAVGQLIENAMESYKQDDRYQVDLVVDCSDQWIHGSAEHIERAVRNLVENALSFARTRVDVTVRRSGERVEIKVADDGKGIPPEDLERVWDRFFTRRDDGGGTGLGLAMTRAIVEAHSGSIDIESTVDVGTVFTVRLPRPERFAPDSAR